MTTMPAPAPLIPQVIYVVGPGRGGSTLLERVLNTSSQAFALGEFHCLWRLPRERLLCACGQSFDACDFWQGVMHDSDLGDEGLAELRRLEWQVARSGYLLRQGLRLRQLAEQAPVQDYLALQGQVYRAIATRSGARYLVDTSKAGPRAWLLGTAARHTVLHLHRPAVDVLTSWRQPKWNPALQGPMRKPPVLGAGADWLKAEAWARALGHRRPVRRLDYAALVQAPRAALGQALDPVAPGLVDSLAWQDERSLQPAASYHSLNGNPNRFDTGLITVRPHPPALHRLPWAERQAVRLVGGALDRSAP